MTGDELTEMRPAISDAHFLPWFACRIARRTISFILMYTVYRSTALKYSGSGCSSKRNMVWDRRLASSFTWRVAFSDGVLKLQEAGV